MRLGIDIRPLGSASGRRGVGSYIRGLIAGLALEMESGSDEIVLFGSGREEDLPVAGRMTRVRLLRPRRAITLWDQIAWAGTLERRGVTVFHSPFYAVPWLRPRSCGVVQTIHDLTPLKLPGTVSRRNALIFRINFALARRADRIIVPSEATRTDAVALLGIPAARIAVIPEAADITPAEVAAAEDQAARVVSRLGIHGRYLLHTGGHDIVKNLARLLEALAVLARQGRQIDLVVAGEHGPGSPHLIGRAAALGLQGRVRWPGFVPRSDLIALYRGASVVVYPSSTEGFGLPVLEAMACGAPVVASGAGAIPEVGGDACLYVDPSDHDQIAKAICRILDDDALAADLSRRGRERAARFTWRETARRTIEVYREALA